eukprot:3932120-Rhodomonas_salina.5
MQLQETKTVEMVRKPTTAPRKDAEHRNKCTGPRRRQRTFPTSEASQGGLVRQSVGSLAYLSTGAGSALRGIRRIPLICAAPA